MSFSQHLKPSLFALALASPLTSLVAPAAQAQQYGVDQGLVMALEQMIGYVAQGCQMGNQQACMHTQSMMTQAQMLISAGQYCMQYNDPNACQYYQTGYVQAQQAYAAMTQGMGGQGMQGQVGVDPNNPLGATHDQRMANIEAWGQANTETWNNTQPQIDANHNQFLSYIQN